MGLKLLFNNLRYLSRLNLKEIEKQRMGIEQIHADMNAMLDNIFYELPEHLGLVEKPKIKNFEQTIDDLIQYRASMCRFGDGEISLIEGGSIRFQKKNKKLAQRLKDILMSQNDKVFIGINYHYYHADLSNVLDFSKHLHRTVVPALRNVFKKYLIPGRQYHAAGFTLAYTTFKEYDFDAYYNKMKNIWHDRDVTIICGGRIFDQLDYNIFENAKSLKYQYAPTMHAYGEYDKILEEAKKIPKDDLVIIILGPTATVLAYDLALEGYQALDMGHVAKDYDAYNKKLSKTKENLITFFRPD